VIPADAGEKVIEAYRDYKFPVVSHDKIGKITNIEDTTSEHLAAVLKTVDANAIRAKKYKVVLDSHHGAGSVLGRRLLEDLGCELQCLGDTPDGLFTRSPEPTEVNLKATTAAAKGFGADAVFCQDPDADRLAIIDESGNYIGEEYTLAITLNQALKTRKGPVVINCSSSRMSADICASHGCELAVRLIQKSAMFAIALWRWLKCLIRWRRRASRSANWPQRFRVTRFVKRRSRLIAATFLHFTRS